MTITPLTIYARKPEGQQCYRCRARGQRGRIRTYPQYQNCDYCGVIRFQMPYIPFHLIAVGSRFYSNLTSKADCVYVKASDEQRVEMQMFGVMNCYQADRPDLHAGFGPLAGCIPEQNLTMVCSMFGYN